MVFFPASNGVGDVDYSDDVALYLPYRMQDETVQLMASYNFDNYEHRKPFTIPSGIRVPIEQLLIVDEHRESYESNDKGDRIGA